MRYLLILSALSVIVSFTSCTHYYYGPNSANVPLMKKEGDGRISASIASADETTGFELQSAYALGNHFGGMFNFYHAGSREGASSATPDNTTEKGNGRYFELG